MPKQDQDKYILRLCLLLSLTLTLPNKSFAADNQLVNQDLPVAHISPNTINRVLQTSLEPASKKLVEKQPQDTIVKTETKQEQEDISAKPEISFPASQLPITPALAPNSGPGSNEAAVVQSPSTLPAVKAEVSSAPSEASLDAVEITEKKSEEFKTPALLDTKLQPTANNNLLSAAGILPLPLPLPLPKPEISGDAPIVIDNDENVETQTTIKYEDLPTDEGKTIIKTGARFPVVITSEITSKSAKQGDPVQARLKYDLKIGDRLVAQKGATVYGHLHYVLKARSAMHSLVSPERWYRNSGALGLTFDEIINEKGEHLPLVAKPARQARIVKNKGEGRELGVNHDGLVTGPWSQQLRYKAIRIGLNAAMTPAGVFSFGAMPVALGVIGAVNPSFAFMKPVGLNVRHRRIKGFAWGFLSGLPGSWIIEDTVVKGQEAVIKPGDEFLAEFNEEFNGEPSSDASLIPGASTKVHGQVIPNKKKH